MAGSNANDLLIDDYCRTGHLSRISKQVAFKSPLGADSPPTMLNALGCFPVVSHCEASGNNAVLSRVTLTGGYHQKLLGSSDATSRAFPGPAAHVYAVPGANLISGAVPNPFPLARANFVAQYFLGGDLWFLEQGGGFQALGGSSHTYFGYGSHFGPSWSLKLPPDRVFSGGASGRLENHTYDNYLLLPVVSSALEPLALTWDSGHGYYAWQKRSPIVEIRTNQIGDSGTGERWDLDIFWQEVRPARRSATASPLSAANAGDAILNGAGLHRGYCYQLFEGNVVMPDFGGSDFRTYVVNPADLRPPLVVYYLDDGAATQPASFTLTFEGLPGSGGAASLPTPQRNAWDSGFGPTYFNLNQALSYAIPTGTVKTEPGTGRLFVGLDFELTIPGGFSKTGTIEYVKAPFVSQGAWNSTPRYYEMILQFTHQTGLP